MRKISISADDLILSLLGFSVQNQICLLDSCGVSHLESHLLIAGIKPLEILQITNESADESLKNFQKKLDAENTAQFFTISYDFGLKLENIKPREKEFSGFPEPDIFLAVFDCLIIHNYNSGETFLKGNEKKFDEIEKVLLKNNDRFNIDSNKSSKISSNFTKEIYIETVEKIQEYIKRGDTYQTNLTQQFRVELHENLTAQQIFQHLRKNHPAPFAAFFKRENDAVVSISPERFLKIQDSKFKIQSSIISVNPIKGTRPRGKNPTEDLRLKNELLTSEKDRAENTMIVDLMRNDIGKICKFGTVKVEKLCDLETHPTLFHLVSTVRGELRENVNFAEILKAVFPCGSITGAPKHRTMQIIDQLETADRGLSMGAIGFCDFDKNLDLNVAIRTLVIRGNEAIFNVGGGIVIDSVPELEYEESLLKAKAIFNALNADFEC